MARTHRLEVWRAYARGEGGVETYGRLWARLVGDPATRASIDAWRKEPGLGPTLARRLERHARLALAGAIEADPTVARLTAELAAAHARRRAFVGGRAYTDQEIAGLLRSEPDRATRERAWRARAVLGAEVAGAFTELVRWRNEAARRVGYASFFSLRLAIAGLDEERLLVEAAGLDAATARAHWDALAERREALRIARVEPWDLFYDVTGHAAFLGSAMRRDRLLPVVARTFAGLGFRLDALPIQMDWDARPGRSPHPMSFPIDPPFDVRVVVDVADGLAAWRTTFHELGHALYSAHYDPELPWVFRDAPAEFVHEGVAELFAGVLEDEVWQADVAGLPTEMGRAIVETRRQEALLDARTRLAMLHFERELYRAEGADPTELWWTVVDRFLGIPHDGNEPVWAGFLHFVTHPVYVPNYLLAGDVAARLLGALRAEVGGFVENPAAGEWLRERIFRPGASRDWKDIVP